MLINELAERYGVSVRTLRYYEEVGLISSARNGSNVRVYGEDQARVLETILVFKRLNVGLGDIKKVLEADDSGFLRALLSDKLGKLDKELVDLKYTKSLLHSVLNTFGSGDLSKNNIEAFLNEQLFISKEDEKWRRILENTDKYMIEIGEGLIPIAVAEGENSLIGAIKDLKADLKDVHGIEIGKIRLRDNPDALGDYEYRLVLEGKVVCQHEVDKVSQAAQVDHVISNLKTVLL